MIKTTFLNRALTLYSLCALSLCVHGTDSARTHRGYKDFWSILEMDESKEITMESARSTMNRAESFFTQRPSLHVDAVNYVMYAEKSLRDRNQLLENAPLAVERLQSTEYYRFHIINTEVFRYTFRTNDTDAWEAIMSDKRERVVNACSIATVQMAVATLPILILFM